MLLILSTFAVNAETTRDVIYGHKDGMALVMDIYQPDGNANGAGVAYMVSGGFMSHLRLQRGLENIFMPLVDNGYTVFRREARQQPSLPCTRYRERCFAGISVYR